MYKGFWSIASAVCLLIFYVIFLYNSSEIKENIKVSATGVKAPETLKAENNIFDVWHECIKKKVESESDHIQFWNRFTAWSSACDSSAEIDKLGLTSFRNRDETKYAIFPQTKNANDPNVLVTLGIGRDIDAEKRFRDKMLEIGQNVTFYGADPMTDVNPELYTEIGDYFPFAVGGEAGFQTASVLLNGNYVNRRIAHIDIIYFVEKVLKLKTIDHIWADAEYAEYGFFDILFNDGRFAKNGIKLCQLNMEVHRPTDAQKKAFMEMIKPLIQEKRYGFFKNQNVGHFRMYLFNFGDDYCVKKFIKPSLVHF